MRLQSCHVSQYIVDAEAKLNWNVDPFSILHLHIVLMGVRFQKIKDYIFRYLSLSGKHRICCRLSFLSLSSQFPTLPLFCVKRKGLQSEYKLIKHTAVVSINKQKRTFHPSWIVLFAIEKHGEIGCLSLPPLSLLYHLSKCIRWIMKGTSICSATKKSISKTIYFANSHHLLIFLMEYC